MLLIERPDVECAFTTIYTDSNEGWKGVNDVWLKGHLGSSADYIRTKIGAGSNLEIGFWHGYDGYYWKKFRPLHEGEEPSWEIPLDSLPSYHSYFNAPDNPQKTALLESIAYFDGTGAPFLTGAYKGRHYEFLKKREQVFREANAQYRKDLSIIIQELEREGEIVISR